MPRICVECGISFQGGTILAVRLGLTMHPPTCSWMPRDSSASRATVAGYAPPGRAPTLGSGLCHCFCVNSDLPLLKSIR